MRRFIYFLSLLFIGETIYAEGIDSTLFEKTFEEISALGLPVLVIETENGVFPTYEIAEKENPEIMWGKGITNAVKVPGSLSLFKDGQCLYSSGDYVDGQSGMTIKVRGNVSAVDHEKKPYKIKLEKKADLLLREGQDVDYSDKNWILIKDNNINAKIGFKINELMQMQWTPSYCFVNVMFNGRYNGVYMLCESVRRNKDCRLNVSKTGFVFEWDTYWWNEPRYISSAFSSTQAYTIKYPDEDEITDEQIDCLENIIRQAESSAFDGTYSDYIDVNSFASWILAHDILGTWDASGSNYFLTKYDDTENSKIMMANLWDLETNFRRVNQWSTAHLAEWFFFGPLFGSENKTFLKAYKMKWSEVSQTLFEDIQNYLNMFNVSDEGYALEKSIILDNQLWGTSWKTVSQSVSDANEWFNARKDWLNNQIGKIEIEESSISVLKTDVDAAPLWVTPVGIEVKSHFKPGIFISQGRKVVIK